MRPRHAFCMCLALLAGCRGDLEARIDELEVARGRLELRVDEAGADRARVLALEAALATPVATPPDVLARLAALETQVLALEEALRRSPAGAPISARTGAADPVIAPGPPGARGGLPRPGEPLEVLSVGSGDLLLVRTPGGLERLVLRGVDPPQRTEVYERDPALRARHGEAWGPHTIATDIAWDAARMHLEGLLRDATVTLVAGTDGAGRGEGGAIEAWLQVTRGEGQPVDVNAAMVQDGFALAERGTSRDADLARAEAEARAARRGVFGPDRR